jgi:hypothetical protein
MKMKTGLVAVLAMAALGACGKKKGSDADQPSESDLGATHGGVPTSREGQMFALGQKLAQAAMANGRAESGVVERTFHAAETIADITLHEHLDPLPVPTSDHAKTTAEGLHYVLAGEGKVLGKKIASDFGPTSSATFELGAKLNLLPMLYVDDPKDTMADTMVKTLGELATSAQLQNELAPLLTKLKARAPMNEVVDMVFSLDDKLPVAIAERYEKT